MLRTVYCYNIEFKNSDGITDETQIDTETEITENNYKTAIDIINTILSIRKEMDITEITDVYLDCVEKYEDYCDYDEINEEDLPF